MRSLVTGATGFLGTALVGELARRFGPENVIALGAPVESAAERASREEFIRLGLRTGMCELRRRRPLGGLDVGAIDVLFHLAADARTNRSYKELAPVNVQGTRSLLVELDGRVRGARVIFASSSAAVDRSGPARAPLTEHSRPAPQTAYGRTKREAEELIVTLASDLGFEYTVCRLSNLYGPGVRSGLFRVLTDWIRRGHPLARIAWPGRASVTYVDDCVAVLIELATLEEAAGRTFLIASAEAPTVTEIAREIGRLLARRAADLEIPEAVWRGVRALRWAPGIRRVFPWRLAGVIEDALWVDVGEMSRLTRRTFVPLAEGVRRMLVAEPRACEAGGQ